MKIVRSAFLKSFLILIFLTILLGVIYPLAVDAILHTTFPNSAEGSLIIKDQKILGSKLIGQNFTRPEYFWGRLSATSPNPYNAASSSGSNFGTNNPDLITAVQARINDLKKFDPNNRQPIPVDLVTASASGLDPDISLAAAYYQVNRVAKARALDPQIIIDLIKKHTSARQFKIFGEVTVNVLELNLDMDHKL